MTGFRGRVGIYEVLPLRSDLRTMIQRGAPESDIRRCLADAGWKTLRDKALQVVEQGESSIEEILRVTRSETCVDKDAVKPVESVEAGT